MGGKFTTTNSSLFTNNNNNSIPSWLEGLSNVDIKEKETIDLNIQPKGVFAEKQTVYREEIDATPRSVQASFSETKLITDAKIHLARFLSGRYYKVEGNVKGNLAVLNVNIDGIPAEFDFGYIDNEGKTKNNETFTVTMNGETSEYPFSKAGFEECISDIKSNKITASKKVQAVGKAFVISKEEIVRRYNGQLRLATDKINELLSEGSIIGVGSNSFASYYDVDHLFPRMEKEAAEAPSPSFEFVSNQEHVAANPNKSEKVLAIEASKMLSELFVDFCIINSVRDNNELLVKANILDKNGIKHESDFCFGIKNEKIAALKIVELNDERMTIEQFLNKINVDNKMVSAYLSQHDSTKHIYRGAVLTRGNIERRLAKIVRSSIIPEIIENWVDRGLVNQVNSTTFTTIKSFEELLASINTKTLTASELEEVKVYQSKFGEGLEIERQDVKDTGVRDLEENFSNEMLLNKVNQFLSSHFKNFKPLDVKIDNEVVNYSMQLFDENSGLSTVININFSVDPNKRITGCYMNVDGKNVDIENVKKAFSMNERLAKYLEINPNKKTDAPMIITSDSLMRKISSITSASEEEIQETIENWEKSNKIHKLSSNMFASRYTFEQLLNDSDIKPLSDDELKERIFNAKKNKDLIITSSYLTDNDTRQLIDNWSPERLVLHAKSELNKEFKDYNIVDFALEDNSYTVTARVVDPLTGMRNKCIFKFSIDGSKPSRLIDKQYDAVNKDVKEYVNYQDGRVNTRSYKNIISRNQLRNKLLLVASSEDIDMLTDTLVEHKILNKIDSNSFASEYSISDIVAHLSQHNKVNLESGKENIETSKRDEHVIKINDDRVMDSDTRILEASEKTLSPRMLELKNKIKVTAEKSYKQKLITSKKLNEINLMLDSSKIEKDLETAWKELKKYF